MGEAADSEVTNFVYDHPKARRPVIIPSYDEVPVTVTKTNMSTVGMSREGVLCPAASRVS